MFKLIFTLLTFSFNLHAQESSSTLLLPELTIAKPKQERASENKATIDNKQLELRQVTTLADALRSVEGLHVVNSGGPGRPTAIFLRGSNAEYVLILIDGVEMNDLLSPSRAANFDNIFSHEVERIEILRGPQTLRYGASALSGVINIITKKGQGAPKRLVKAELGKYSAIDGMVGISGGEPDSNYDIRYSQFQTDGFSVADAALGNHEADALSQTQISGRFGAEPIKNLNLDLSIRYIDTFSENDLDGVANRDDPDYYTDARKLLASLKTNSSSKNGFLNLDNTLAIQRFDRVTQNSPDTQNALSSYENYHGQFLKLASVSSLNWSQKNVSQIGIDFKEDRGRSNQFSERSYRYIGAFVSHSHYTTEGVFFDVGGRWDQQIYEADEVFRDCENRCYFTTQNGIGYAFSQDTRVRIGGGTSIKQPSLYQLYSSFGNPSLKTERGTGADLSFEHSFAHGYGRLSSSVFYNHFENLIGFQSNRYVNQGEAETFGAEFVARTPVGPGVLIGGTYTLLRTQDLQTGLRLLRRPNESASADLQLNITPRLQLLHSTNFVGARDDFDVVSSNRKSLPHHFVSRLVANYELDENSKISTRIENLYARKYQEIDGYGTSRRAAFISFASQF